MGAVELLRVIWAAVFSEHVSGDTVPVVNLKEVIVAVGAALQIKERKCNTQNLKERQGHSSETSATSQQSRPLVLQLVVLVSEHRSHDSTLSTCTCSGPLP